MEFLKGKWAYVLLGLALLLVLAAIAYLLLSGEGGPYTGGLLVKMESWRGLFRDVCAAAGRRGGAVL